MTLLLMEARYKL